VYKLRRIIRFGRIAALMVAASAIADVAPAFAQGFFESLFGRPRPRVVQPESLPPQVTAYADPFGPRESRRSDGNVYSGRGSAFCVRTCDGRYFPLQHHAGVSPAELCRSFCPTAQTMVFSGGSINSAVAPNGTRYADLDNAFAYRDKVVDNCTCNGKDSFGLARMSPVVDPTLRAGDIVATNDGLANFRGKTSGSAEFTPINASAAAWAQKLSAIKVRPAPPAPQVAAAPVEDEGTEKPRRDRRRAQFFR
jgi:hypothetical protein